MFYPFRKQLPSRLVPSYFSEMFSGALPKTTGLTNRGTKRKRSELIQMSPPTKKIMTSYHHDNAAFTNAMHITSLQIKRIMEDNITILLMLVANLFPLPQTSFQEIQLSSIPNQTPTIMIPSTSPNVFSVAKDHEVCKLLETSPSSAASDSVASLYLRILSYIFRDNAAPSVPLLSAFLRPLGLTLLVVPPRGDCPLDGFPTTPTASILLINHPRKQRATPGCPFGGQGIG